MKNVPMYKRGFSWVLVVAMLFSLLVPAVSAETPAQTTSARKITAQQIEELTLTPIDAGTLESQKLNKAADDSEAKADYQPSDVLRVSIELNKASTIDAGFQIEGIAANAEAKAYRNALKADQVKMTAKIESVLGKQLDVKWNLTLAANMISANVAYGDIEKIEAIDGVSRVIIENRYEPQKGVEADEPNNGSASRMIGSDYAWAAGYYGAGSKVAVIDTGIDSEHQSFSGEGLEYAFAQTAEEKGMTYDEYVATLNLLTPESIDAVKDQLNANIGSGAAVYRSTKIGYGYNYVDNRADYIEHNLDTQGEHGSHVEGISAANRFVKIDDEFEPALEAVGTQGVAPDAQIVTMKVFGQGGGAYDSDYMVAIEDAIILGCDSANLSLGSGSPGFSFSGGYEEIMNKLVENGTVVSFSAGNSGMWYDAPYNSSMAYPYLYIDDNNFATGGSPGSFTNALTVASVDNIGQTGMPLKFGDRSVFYTENTDYGNTPFAGLANEDGYEYVLIDGPGVDDNDHVGQAGDQFLELGSAILEGKVAICKRGTSSFFAKANAAFAQGAVAVIIYNNQPGTIGMNLTGLEYEAPVVSITQADGEAIKASSEEHTTAGGAVYYTGTLTIGTELEVYAPDPTDDVTVSSFSSFGVPGTLVLKPEILAPGGSIYSVNGYHQRPSSEGGGFAGGSDQYELMSGTSMAAPQVNGMAGVLGQYIRENDLTGKTGLSQRQLINSLLMSTAHPVYDSYGEYYPVIRVGAGLANVGNAVSAQSYILMDEDSTMFPDSARDGKVKAELGDDPERTGSYSYKFTVYPMNESKEFTLRTDLFMQGFLGSGGYGYLQDNESMLLEELPSIFGMSDPGYSTSYEVNGKTYKDYYTIDADVNADGETNGADVQLILDYTTNTLAEDAVFLEDVADVDGDGAITTYDAHLLMESVATETITITEPTEVTVNIQLTDVAMMCLDYLYNATYIEGYTFVDPVADEEGAMDVVHSIPILAYYGSWTDNAMFDRTSPIDEAYGTGKLPYLNNANTNYLSVKDEEGTSSVYMGNPYTVEDEFPADKLAMSSQTTIDKANYLNIRNIATLGFAIQDEEGEVLFAQATETQKYSAYYYVNGAVWQNYSPANYNIGKKLASAGVSEGDKVTVGFYGLPEYYGIVNAKANGEVAATGGLDTEGFKSVLATGIIGDGAAIKYTVTIDDTAPEVLGATRDLITGDLSVKASDNQYIAYVAITNKSGSKVYAGIVPEQSEPGQTVEVPLDLEGQTLPAAAVLLVGDYAGNEAAFEIQLGGGAAQDSTMVGFVTAQTTAAPGSGNRAWEIDAENLWYNQSSDSYDGLSVYARLDVAVKAAEYVDGCVFMAGDDGWLYAAKLEELEEAARVAKYADVTENIYDMAFNYTNKKLYALGDGNVIYTVDLLTGELTEAIDVTLPGASGNANGLAIGDDGTFYLTSEGTASSAKLYKFSLGGGSGSAGPVDPGETAYSWGFEDGLGDWTAIDSDGDGYNWTWNQNASSWYSGTPDFDGMAHTGTGCMLSGSFINTVGALTPDNWLVSPAIDLSEAGTASVRFWLGSIDPSYPEQVTVYAGTSASISSMTAVSSAITTPASEDYEQQVVDLSAYAGQSAVYVAFRNNGTNDMFIAALDDVEILVGDASGSVQQPSKAALPAKLTPKSASLAVETPKPVSGSVQQPSKAALPAADETPAPSDAVYSYSFETDDEFNAWTNVDVDGDDNVWYVIHQGDGGYSFDIYDGDAMLTSASYASSALTPDNWFVSPAMSFTGIADPTLSVWAQAQDADWASEVFALYAGTTNDINEMVLVGGPYTQTAGANGPKTSSGSWYQYTADLSAYADASQVYVAVRHYNCTDMFRLNVDLVEIYDGDPVGPVDPPEPPTPVDGLVAGYYFETEDEVNEWTFTGDGECDWIWSENNLGGYDYSDKAHEGSAFLMGYSFVDNDGAYQADNWAISPAVTLPADGAAQVSFYATNANADYPEPFSVYVGTSADPASMTLLEEFVTPSTGWTDEWTHYTYDLSDYAGQTVYLAFYDNNYDGYEIWIDQVEITSEGSVEPPEPPTPVDSLVAGYYFESASDLDAWTMTGDGDADWIWSGNNLGGYDYSEYAHEGSGFMMCYSFVDYQGACQADNWAISPAVTLPANGAAQLSFYATNANASYPEAFSVYVGTSADPAEMTALATNLSPATGPDAWTNYTFDLSDYAGQTVYVGFYDYNYDAYEIWIDQVEITSEGSVGPPTGSGYLFSFEGQAEFNEWKLVDADGDGYNWMLRTQGDGDNEWDIYDGDYMAFSASYLSGALTPDNWLISPALDLSDAAADEDVSFWAQAQDASWPSETFAVYAGNTDDPDDMTMIGGPFTLTAGANGPRQVAGSWYNFTAPLGEFAGDDEVYIAFRHYNCTDMFYMNLDYVDVAYVPAEPGPGPGPIGPDPVVAVTAEAVGSSLGANNASYGGGLAWDHNEGILYLVSNTSETQNAGHYLWIVNTTTGVAARANSVQGSNNSSSNPSARLYGAVNGLFIVPVSGTMIDETETATSIEIDPSELTLLRGQTSKVVVSVFPWTLTDKGYTIESADPEIASVDSKGYVTGLAVGETTLTATSNAEPHLTAEIPVTVKEAPVAELRGIVWDEEGKGQASVFSSDATNDWQALAAVGALRWGARVGDVVYGSTDDTMYAFDADTYEVTQLGGIVSMWIPSDADELPQDFRDAFAEMGYNVGPVIGPNNNGTYLTMLDPEAGSLIYFDLGDTVFGTDPMATFTYAGRTVYYDGESTDYDGGAFLGMTESGELYLFTLNHEGSVMWQSLGATGIDLTGVSDATNEVWASMVYDADNEFLYLTVYNGEDDKAFLYAIDVNEPAANCRLGDFNEKVWPVVGLYQYEPATELSLKVSPESVDIWEEETAQLTIKVKLGETNGFTCESADEAIATVDETGLITGVSRGETTVTVTTKDVNSADEHLSVEVPVNVKGYVPAPVDNGNYPEVDAEIVGVKTAWDFETDPIEDGWTFFDRDCDGHNWIWTPGTSYSSLGAYNGVGQIISQSYSGGALTPDNFAITPAIDMSGYTDATVAMYAKAQLSSWPDEVFAFYAGTTPVLGEMIKISPDFTATGSWTKYAASLKDFAGEPVVYVALRHYNCTDQYALQVDNFQLLTVDGEIPEPPTGGELRWSFESETEIADWTMIDRDGDNKSWSVYSATAVDGSSVLSATYNSSAISDDWAITPALDFSELTAPTLSAWFMKNSSSYNENYAIYAGTTADPDAMTELLPEKAATQSWVNEVVDLSDFAGESTVYVAFRHTTPTADQFRIYLDLVEITDADDVPDPGTYILPGDRKLSGCPEIKPASLGEKRCDGTAVVSGSFNLNTGAAESVQPANPKNGGVNAASDRIVKKAKLPVIGILGLEGEVGDNLVTVNLTEDVDVTNGLIHIVYDNEKLTFTGLTSAADCVSVNTDDDMRIIFAYAAAEAIPAGDPIATLTFTYENGCVDTNLLTTTQERNDEFELWSIEQIPIFDVTYGEPVWNWAEDYSSATATFTSLDGRTVQVLDAEITDVTTDPTYEADGSIVYTATVTLNDTEYTDDKNVTIPKLEHTYEEPVWNWADDYSSATATFTSNDDPENVDEQTVEATVNSEQTDPGCTTAGQIVYTATVTFKETAYSDVQTVVLEALGHSWDEGVVTIDPTCTANGVKTFTCTVCGEKRTEAVDPTGHTPMDVAAVAPTCTEAGQTAGKQCSACGAILEGMELVLPKGHTVAVVAAVAPTCTETGLTAGAKCADCGAVLVAQETIAATGHTEEILPAVAPTCTETGLTEGKKCSVCGVVLTAQTVIPAAGHVEVILPAVAATCVDTGLTEGKKCSVCGEILVAQQQTPKAAHTEQIIPAVAPTCTAPGMTEGKKCSICGEILVVPTAVPANEHSWNSGEITSAATCTNAGIKTFTCTVCGEKRLEAISATGHTPESVAAIEPTCTAAGQTAGQKCSVCGAILSGVAALPAKGHTIVSIPAIEASCVAGGKTEGAKCSVCGELIVAQKDTDALGHSWNEGEITKAPSVKEAGVMTYTCERCGEKKTEPIAKLNGIALQLLLTIAGQLDPSACTPESAAAFNDAVAAAQDALQNAASQEAIDEAAQNLLDAIEGLEPGFRFDDVKDSSKYYYAPVYWAYYHEPQITKGTTETEFSPDATVTRGQAVTFLWRAAGEPAPSGSNNPFTDVKETSYCYKAVLWAVEKGITNGTTATTFSPDDTCSRGHIITFIWRWQGQPKATIDNPFTDAPAGKFYTDAAVWAVENGLVDEDTGVTADTFGAAADCTRADTVTFLYRMFKD